MKILAINLPQFHTFPENDKWWGKGFTEWTNVKKAKPLYDGHVQPLIPYNENYYDLSKIESIADQSEMAKKYGVSGFVYYHYWFNGKLLMEKPCELLLDNKCIDIEYCFCWANEPWTRAWDGKNKEIIMPQTFGGVKDWDKHIRYFIRFFKDERYIKIDNSPVLFVYSPCEIPEFEKMMEYWNEKLQECGFDGVYLVEYISTKNPKAFSQYSKAVMEFEPLFTCRFEISMLKKAIRFVRKKMKVIDKNNYDYVWSKMLGRQSTYDGREIFRGAMSGWDNTPRKGKSGMVIQGATPEKFGKYLDLLAHQMRKDFSDRYIVINAWNEWGEGAILEPTEQYGFRYLEELKAVADKIKD